MSRYWGYSERPQNWENTLEQINEEQATGVPIPVEPQAKVEAIKVESELKIKVEPPKIEAIKVEPKNDSSFSY